MLFAEFRKSLVFCSLLVPIAGKSQGRRAPPHQAKHRCMHRAAGRRGWETPVRANYLEATGKYAALMSYSEDFREKRCGEAGCE